MITKMYFVLISLMVVLGYNPIASGQANTAPVSVNSSMVLDAAGPQQRKSLSNIFLIECQHGQQLSGGTGFLIDSGVIVTNAHVTATCDETTLIGVSPSNMSITFSTVIKDQNRDLALLVPKDKLGSGFKLATSDVIQPGTLISTWGYPFLYNGTSPLLSVGYISGYRNQLSNGANVKHIVVNGAFNHGNSGGPLLISQHNEVIGIVILTYLFYPPEVKQIIDGLIAQRSGMGMGSIRQADGSVRPVSEAEVTGIVLNEFYEKTQVMIGEAIAVSELQAMLKEHSKDLSSSRH